MFLNRIAMNRDLALGGQPPFMEQVTVAVPAFSR